MPQSKAKPTLSSPHTIHALHLHSYTPFHYKSNSKRLPTYTTKTKEHHHSLYLPNAYRYTKTPIEDELLWPHYKFVPQLCNRLLNYCCFRLGHTSSVLRQYVTQRPMKEVRKTIANLATCPKYPCPLLYFSLLNSKNKNTYVLLNFNTYSVVYITCKCSVVRGKIRKSGPRP